jgi:SAM-dependent methyltransferase
MKNEAEWWTPDELVATEERIRLGLLDTTPDVRNDYGSYGALAGGADPVTSGLYLHNEFESWRIATVCADYLRLVVRTRRETPSCIADLGCGAGFTTDGLKQQWPSAHVVGFELSHDAVTYARRKWSACEFIQGAVRLDASLAGGPYDVILCQEFYPFTRTASASDHAQWLELVSSNLSARGVGIVTVSSANRQCINTTYSDLRLQFNLRRVHLAAPRLARKLPFVLSRAAGSLLRVVRPQWARSIYLLHKNP